MKSILITGMSRSGTTMLEKMISSHTDAEILSQPFPLLYRYLKQTFYIQYNYDKSYYVFNKFYNERFYTLLDFENFLNHYSINSDEIDVIFNKMKGWEGQWTKISDWEILLENYKSTNFKDLYNILLQHYASSDKYKIIGSKEVLIEEFIPFFVSNNIRVIIIIRDPRDIITSLNVGKGTTYGGKHRPTLFHLRNWRKSVAIANTFINHKNLLIIRYEDLIDFDKKTLNLITHFLDISDFSSSHFENGIYKKNGEMWAANSSIDNLTLRRQKYKHFLDENTIKYIEFICEPEMKLMKYKLDYERDLKNYNPMLFKEPFKIEDVKMNRNLSTDKSEISLEFKRKELLKSGIKKIDDINALFISKNNYDLLK